MTDKSQDSAGMSYLDSLPRRWVTLYIPVIVFLIVLLFPFYWMAMTAGYPPIWKSSWPEWSAMKRSICFIPTAKYLAAARWTERCRAARKSGRG